MDFTLEKYKELLLALKSCDRTFQKVSDFIDTPAKKTILLRHDIDAKKYSALKFARIQHELNIQGTYYFRTIPKIYDEQLICKIASLGHEIGYHYETLDKAYGNLNLAYSMFCDELEKLRNIVPVHTICMHGSPLSKYDNRDIWKEYNYKDLGIIFEPYFDLDFSSILYLTDTGRRWDGQHVSIRDNPAGGDINTHMQGKSQSLSNSYSFHCTNDIIKACKSDHLPDAIMFNFHPHRWSDKTLTWIKELVMQNTKNIVKAGLKKFRTN